MIDHLPDKSLGVDPVCRVLDLSPSTYLARKKRPKSARQPRDVFARAACAEWTLPIRSPVSCSRVRTVRRCGRRPCWTASRHWSAQAGVPQFTMHDLRRVAATLTITAGVPLTVVSKTLRHSTLSTTANIYAHLTRQAAHDAVDAIEAALVGAEGEDARIDLPSRLRPHRDHPARLRDLSKPLYAAAIRGRSMMWLGGGRRPCDHTATTSPRNAEKAAFPFLRRRPPTCVNAGRDDRI
ncbi:tyrosine-type recombinase/integrase [Embleya scabrispora]|uniref:tyrosine-type recombinase/integrase n=1 Tax=Embleya scabrispora TaxID=159449 RepID=UPI001374B4EF|nr:tyrosine-type recombinase/integrase [Embleya scabrispora]